MLENGQKAPVAYAWALAVTPLVFLVMDVLTFLATGRFDSPVSIAAGLALAVGLAILDSRALARHGVYVPWFWAVILFPVYLVLRTTRSGSTFLIPMVWLVLVIGYGVILGPPILNSLATAGQ